MGVSQAAFEFTIEKMQQTNRRLVIAIIALVVLFAVTVGGMVFAFLKYEEQFNTGLRPLLNYTALKHQALSRAVN